MTTLASHCHFGVTFTQYAFLSTCVASHAVRRNGALLIKGKRAFFLPSFHDQREHSQDEELVCREQHGCARGDITVELRKS